MGYDINITTAAAGTWSVYADTVLIGSVTASTTDAAPSDIETSLVTAINAGSSLHGFSAIYRLWFSSCRESDSEPVAEVFSINKPSGGANTITAYTTTIDNRFAEQHIREFYSQAGTGTELWVNAFT